MRSIKRRLCSTQRDRVETDGLLIVESYKYTYISIKVYKDGLSHREYTAILVSHRVNQDL